MHTKKTKDDEIPGNNSLDLLIQRWIDTHTDFERYILIFSISFKILKRLKVNSQSRLAKFIVFFFCVVVLLGFPLIITAVLDQWDSAPIGSWAGIAVIFGLIGAGSFNIYYEIGLNVSSIGHNVVDEEAIQRQIAWDKFWFSLPIGGTVGMITATIIVASLVFYNQQITGVVIPVSSLLVIGILSYQIGEVAFFNMMMCFEARNFANMEHVLYRFNPLETDNLQRAITGYNQFGILTSLVMAIFIASSAILLPDYAYLTNPTWIILILAVYLIVILAVILPRSYIQKIVKQTKKKELEPIRQKLNIMFDRLIDLNKEEYDEMLRLEKVQTMVSEAPESCLPYNTIGRVFGTLVLPTLTFILAVLSEVYLSVLLEKIIK